MILVGERTYCTPHQSERIKEGLGSEPMREAIEVSGPEAALGDR
jgi:hypothetical protein